MVNEKIEEAIHFYSNLTPRWIWSICSSTRHRSLGDSLKKYGFKKVEEKHPLMALNLKEINEGFPTLEGLEISKVMDEATLSVWSRAHTIAAEDEAH